jgi:uncharacterized repeat protein (TIGR03806 family)
LRNPWRFTFDRETGDLWAGDVGWASYEEIDRIVSGGYYGWSTHEGLACLDESRCDEPSIEPVIVLGHDQMRSVTAGYVYRGQSIPALRGRMVFGDFVTGYVWAFDPQTVAPKPEAIAGTGLQITSFAQDHDGELYIVDLVAGSIWRLEPSDDSSAPQELPATLSGTGCFGLDGVPESGLIPYDLNWPFFSDGATKRRWIALPDGETIDVVDDDLDFPVGTLVFKEFSIDSRRVETRVLVHHGEADWGGYTYVWREDQSDADLLRFDSGSSIQDWPGQSWYYPARPECLGCHTTQAGRTIGPQIAQLNGDFQYPNGRVANQLATLQHIGVFSGSLAPPGELPSLPSQRDSTVSLTDRARAWLHANCSNCHQPGSNAMGDIDLRFFTSLRDTRICDAPPTHGTLDIRDARIVALGDPARSVLLARIRSDGTNKMPPRSGLSFDEEGAALLEEWIRSLTSCD